MKTGWFSDVPNDPEEIAKQVDGFPWQPCLQLDGFCLSLDIWFRTEEDCDEFIRESLAGQQALTE